MEIKIVATTGRAQGEAVQVRASKFFIGRHDNCQLRPDFAGLAGIHALVEQRDGHAYLRDFGAEGGTGLNDRVLHAKEAEVFDGDLVQIGPMVLTLAIKPKADDPKAYGYRPGQAHAIAPDGWPYLEAVADEASSAESTPTPTVAPPRPQPQPHPRPEPAPEAASTGTSTAAVVLDLDPPQVARPAVQAPTPAEPRPPAPARRAAPAIGIPSHRHLHHRAVACEMIEGVLVAKIIPPELSEEETVSPFRHELRSLLEEDPPGRMVIDLGNTKFLSSRAVGVILAHYQGLERRGGSLRVCGVSKEIKPVLDQMRLSMLIDIYPTVEEAVRDPWE